MPSSPKIQLRRWICCRSARGCSWPGAADRGLHSSGFLHLLSTIISSSCCKYIIEWGRVEAYKNANCLRKLQNYKNVAEVHNQQTDVGRWNVCRGWILGLNPDTSLKSFPHCYSQLPLQLLKFIFLQTHATSFVFLQTQATSYALLQFSYCTL